MHKIIVTIKTRSAKMLLESRNNGKMLVKKRNAPEAVENYLQSSLLRWCWFLCNQKMYLPRYCSWHTNTVQKLVSIVYLHHTVNKTQSILSLLSRNCKRLVPFLHTLKIMSCLISNVTFLIDKLQSVLLDVGTFVKSWAKQIISVLCS